MFNALCEMIPKVLILFAPTYPIFILAMTVVLKLIRGNVGQSISSYFEFCKLPPERHSSHSVVHSLQATASSSSTSRRTWSTATTRTVKTTAHASATAPSPGALTRETTSTSITTTVRVATHSSLPMSVCPILRVINLRKRWYELTSASILSPLTALYFVCQYYVNFLRCTGVGAELCDDFRFVYPHVEHLIGS